MARRSVPITECFSLESPIATEYRRLFQNLKEAEAGSEMKSLLVTSAVTGEGKSTISSLLAITAARKGHKTLLIDADIRRPSVHRLFHLERQLGLVEVISEGVPYKAVIKKTSLENLDAITAGKVNAHPSELFNTQAIDELIRELKFYYDYLIVDSPPVIPVSDPMLLAKVVDGVILIVKAGETAREVARRAIEIMNSNKARVLGVVLNNAKSSLPYYYDYSHYHYNYSQTGQERGGPRKADQRNRKAKKTDGSEPVRPKKADASRDGKHLAH